MSEDFEHVPVPPGREIPKDIRGRITAAVEVGLDERTGRGKTAGLAAAVVALAAAAVAVPVLVRDTGEQVAGDSPAPPPAVAPMAGGTPLARCQAVPGLPPADQWEVVFQEESKFDFTTLAVRTPAGPLFCEVTPATVTVSDPGVAAVPVPGGQTAALLMTSTGTVAGVMDPSLAEMGISIAVDGAFYQGTVTPRDGLFVLHSGFSTTKGEVTVRLAEDVELPKAPAPKVVVDRGQVADRSSQEGRWLGTCLEKAATRSMVLDADTWVPAVVAEGGEGRLITMDNAMGVSVCHDQRDDAAFDFYVREGAPSTWLPKPVVAYGTGRPGTAQLVAGTFPEGARIEVRYPGGGTGSADLVRSTFVLDVPAYPLAEGTTARVLGAGGEVLYDGPFS